MEHTTHTGDILTDIIILLTYSALSVAIFRTFNLPPILGYLLVGVVAGKHALQWIPSNETIHFMGEVGVVFLLFAIGLEFSLKQLLKMKHVVLGLGGLQVLISTLASAAILYFNQDVNTIGAIIAGGAMTMSSTAIVAKQLTEQGEIHAQHGKLAISILLFQDLAVVPFLVAIPLLGSGGVATIDEFFFINFTLGAMLFIGMLLIGRYTLRPLFHFVASQNSLELFNLTVLFVALVAAWVTNFVGLSLALGAFLAGMMLSETEYKHQIETEIRPFRDILMALFFVTVGTQLDPDILPDIWPTVLLLVLGLTVGKAMIIAILSRFFAADNGVSLRTGLVLGQGGEFGFALLTLSLAGNIIDNHIAQATLAAIIISMAISPIVIRYNGIIAQALFMDSYFFKNNPSSEAVSQAIEDVNNHVIICGYSRVGQSLARFLREQDISYIALELDPKIIKAAWESGDRIFYGDSTQPEMVKAAGLSRARLVVITLNDTNMAKSVVESVRTQNRSIPIVVRTQDDTHMESLERLGATDVVPETLEATMMIAQRILDNLGVDSNDALRTIDRVRLNRYNSLRTYFHGSSDIQEDDETNHLTTITLRKGDFAIDKTLGELDLYPFKIKVMSLRRGRIRGDLPPPKTILKKDDTLVIQGNESTFEALEDYLRQQ